MKQLLSLMELERAFADFCRTQNPELLAQAPNECPDAAALGELAAMHITALSFPCLRIADNGKTAMGMWMAESAAGNRPIAAEFLDWGGCWKLWHLILNPTTENLPAKPYERKYPDPKPMPKPAAMPLGGPGGPSGPGGPGGEGPNGPGGPPPMPDMGPDPFEDDYGTPTVALPYDNYWGWNDLPGQMPNTYTPHETYDPTVSYGPDGHPDALRHWR